jgi:hypothetical protein
MTKVELIKDLKFCKELIERLEQYAIAHYRDTYIDNNHTVIQNDIIRLRRELNEIRIKLGQL